jgi:hypothetical protein
MRLNVREILVLKPAVAAPRVGLAASTSGKPFGSQMKRLFDWLRQLEVGGVDSLGNPELLLKVAQLTQREQPVVTRPQALDSDVGKVRAGETEHWKTNGLSEPANLPILPLFQGQLEPSLAIFDSQHPNVDGLRGLAVNDDGPLEPLDLVFCDLALNFGNVDLLDFALRMEQPHREVAVVRQKQHSARRVVEPTDRNQPPGNGFDERRYGRASLWVVGGTHRSTRLVQQNVNERLSNDAFAIEFDALSPQIRLDPELRYDTTVHSNPSSQDELFGFASRRDTRTSQDLLQSVSHEGRAWQSFRRVPPGVSDFGG